MNEEQIERLIDLLFKEIPELLQKSNKIDYASICYTSDGTKFNFSSVFFGEETGCLWGADAVRGFLLSKYKKHWGTLEVE